MGEPSPQLDNAWKSLVKGVFVILGYFWFHEASSKEDQRANAVKGQAIDLRDEEAAAVADITYQKSEEWYLTGPDAFHQLHCFVCSNIPDILFYVATYI